MGHEHRCAGPDRDSGTRPAGIAGRSSTITIVTRVLFGRSEVYLCLANR